MAMASPACVKPRRHWRHGQFRNRRKIAPPRHCPLHAFWSGPKSWVDIGKNPSHPPRRLIRVASAEVLAESSQVEAEATAGFLLYSDLGKQPDLISNPIGTSINHTIFFFYLGILGFIIYIENKKLIFSFSFLFFASILFELLHLIIPNRAFELNDLFANILGVLLAFFIFNLMKKLIN